MSLPARRLRRAVGLRVGHRMLSCDTRLVLASDPELMGRSGLAEVPEALAVESLTRILPGTFPDPTGNDPMPGAVVRPATAPDTVAPHTIRLSGMHSGGRQHALRLHDEAAVDDRLVENQGRRVPAILGVRPVLLAYPDRLHLLPRRPPEGGQRLLDPLLPDRLLG